MKVKIINTSENKLPAYETTGSAGMDLRANLKQAIHLQPRERVLVPTGLKIQLPEGYEAQVRPRSGLALKEGITVLNSPGTIDSDYTGDVGVILINHGEGVFFIQNGDRIAQLVFQKVEQAEFEVVDSLEKTQRGEGGFGSTGVKEKIKLSKEAEFIYQQVFNKGKSTDNFYSPDYAKECAKIAYNIAVREKKYEIAKEIGDKYFLNIKYHESTIPESKGTEVSISENYEDAANRFLQEMMNNGFHFDSQHQLEITKIYINHRILEG